MSITDEKNGSRVHVSDFIFLTMFEISCKKLMKPRESTVGGGSVQSGTDSANFSVESKNVLHWSAVW